MVCRVVIYLQRDLSAQGCLHPVYPPTTTSSSPELPLLELVPSHTCPKTKTCSYHAAFGLGNRYVRLNVGGTLYYSTLQVLTRLDSLFKTMFSGKMEVFTDKEGKGKYYCFALLL